MPGRFGEENDLGSKRELSVWRRDSLPGAWRESSHGAVSHQPAQTLFAYIEGRYFLDRSITACRLAACAANRARAHVLRRRFTDLDNQSEASCDVAVGSKS